LTYATSTVPVPNTGFGGPGALVSASCPQGKHVVGGGIKLADEDNEFVNDRTATGWAGTVNANATGFSATVTAICATVKRVSGAPAG
jgi:hypothetical protein